ncbi:DUF3168 domain-containing protein [Methylopila sp. 73B]|uniref:DUF3168 domain-containing protein n=1 Tax=Methylopila sp. 73B TaxID=1120792 RepID=UPI00036C4079|nr:DUF3168 domain-containing protein [Methylopila sp. 73B]
MSEVSATLSLRAAVYQHLILDTALAALLGGAHVYDEPPRAAAAPYVALGGVETRDLSGDAAPVEEHLFALEVVSREGGLAEALKIADRLVRRLDGAALSPEGHSLASLAWRFTDSGRAADNGRRRATVSFRAVTEPL